MSDVGSAVRLVQAALHIATVEQLEAALDRARRLEPQPIDLEADERMRTLARDILEFDKAAMAYGKKG